MIQFKKLTKTAKLPEYKSVCASGADIYADEDKALHYGSVEIISTGLQVGYIFPGYEIQIRPRSGLSSKGIIIPNSPGTIDNDYRGELKILLLNLNQEFYIIKRGDRIAQMVFAQIQQQSIQESDKIDNTERGEKGFGSTGR